MEILKSVAQLMALSARTAPKSHGIDFVEIKIIDNGAEIERLSREMVSFGERSGKENFDRDAESVANSQVVVLIGIKEAESVDLNCGACGFPCCSEMKAVPKTDLEFCGPQCAFRLLDMGIAIGSAVKTASLLNVDNRVMYRIGAVARSIGLVDWDYVMGIPLSATGKNIYFDRKR